MTVSPIIEPETRDLRRVAARRSRYAAQRTVWAETRIKRVALCGRTVTSNAGGVAVKVTGTPGTPDARAGFSGLQSCGSVHACPVCAEKVNAERQAQLEAGIRGWLAAGHAVVFGTLTMRHNRGHRLAALLDAIGPAWHRTTSGAGRPWNGGKDRRGGFEVGDRAAFGIKGVCRVVETKHGENGWHPHVHFLLFLERDLDRQALADLEGRMFGRWESALARRGFSVLRSVGIDLRPVSHDSDDLASYFTKARYSTSTPGRAAFEVMGSQAKRQGKGGRTPFEILADLVRDGLADDLDLWHEWEQASHGRRQITWSRGLRALLALGAEKSDQEVVDEDAGGLVLFVLRTEEVTPAWAARRWLWLEAAETGTLGALVEPVLAARFRT